MARAECTYICQGVRSGTLVAVAGATVNVYEQGTTTYIAQTMWDDIAAGNVQVNPLISNSVGAVRFWLDAGQFVTITWTAPGWVGVTETVPVITATPSGGDSVHTHAMGDISGLDIALAADEKIANRDQPNGYPTTDANDLINTARLGTGVASASVVLLGSRAWGAVTATQADSTIEKTANKNANSGYVGLDSAGHLGVTRINPSGTNGQVLTTVAGAVAWAAPAAGGGANAPFQFAPDFQAPQSGDYAQMRCSVATSVTAFHAQRTGGTGANMDVLKNGVSILTAQLSLTATTDTTGTLVTSPTTFAIGDILKIVVSSQTGSPSDIMASADGSRVTF